MSRSHSSFGNNHPHTRINAYLEGTLSESAHRKVREHLNQCSTCRVEAEERARLLALCEEVELQDAHHPSHQDERPVLERRPGTSGWKVVAGLGAVTVLVVGVLVVAWAAGGKTGSSVEVSAGTSNDGDLLPEEAYGEEAGAVSPDPAEIEAAEGSESSADSASEEASESSTPEAHIRLSGTEINDATLHDLRSYGWSVARLSDLSLDTNDTSVEYGDDWASVSTVLSSPSASTSGVTVVRECRHTEDVEDAESTQAQASEATSDKKSSSDQAQPCPSQEVADSDDVQDITLPDATVMTLYNFSDGSWTAIASTQQAHYQIDSTTNSGRASRVMSSLVLTEQARIQEGAVAEQEESSSRLDRGFARILPWRDSAA